MSYKAELEFQKRFYKVLDFVYQVGRNTDESGRVASDPGGAFIHLVVEATEHTAIIESMVNNKFKPTEGKIIFHKSNAEGILTTLSWENGFVTWHQVELSLNSEHSMKIRFNVHAETIRYGESVFNGKWPE
ncbi:type VI secretion system tube protein TssD [Chitinophagaceae bacterium LWZ2-11]